MRACTRWARSGGDTGSSCPSREQLGSYLLRALPDDAAGYIAFHLDAIGCRCCQANLADLENQQAEAGEVAQTRRRRYFQSSAGYLRPEPSRWTTAR